MAPWMATILVGGISLLGNVMATAFFYGRLSQRVDTHSDQFEQVDEKFNKIEFDQDEQWREINHSRENIAKIKGKFGINGA